MQFLTLNKGRSSTSFILNKGKKGKVTGGTVDTVKVDGKPVAVVGSSVTTCSGTF